MRCSCGTALPPDADWCHKCLTPAGRIRLLNQVAETAATTPSQAEARLREAEKVVYRSSRLAGSATTFGPLGRLVATVLALVPAAALGVHAFLHRQDPATVLELLLGVVPALGLAALVLRDVWQPSKKAERVLVERKLG